MALILRFGSNINGGITFTGNTLGLSKRTNYGQAGRDDSIGCFITTDETSQFSDFPPGTTNDWTLNTSSAELVIPSGSKVTYAELIWGGSYRCGGEDVTDHLNEGITFITPKSTETVYPDPETFFKDEYGNFYTRTAVVTDFIKQGGPGIYVAGRIPGTVAASENSFNHAGWTLAVIYENEELPKRNITLFAGSILIDEGMDALSYIGGFATPPKGPQNGRMLASAQEGDSVFEEDKLYFGPSVDDLFQVSGPNNPYNNFFCSQINGDDGRINTTGSFGDRNSSIGSTGYGCRQGWDITNVDISPALVDSQTTGVIRMMSDSDTYLLNALGLQIDVNCPEIRVIKSCEKSWFYIGEEITYTVNILNHGRIDVYHVIFKDPLPEGMRFVEKTFRINGSLVEEADPVQGVDLGELHAGDFVTVSFNIKVESMPENSIFLNQSHVDFQYEFIPNDPPVNSNKLSNQIEITVKARENAGKRGIDISKTQDIVVI